jgi:flagellar protein FlgJ
LENKLKFKKRLHPTALDVQQNFGIGANLIITQAAHESNWGESELTRIANNLFGMTAGKSWLDAKKEVFTIHTKEYSKLPPGKIRYWNREGDVIDKKDDGHGGSILNVNIDFRRYGNWDESVQDWAQKISKSERYEEAYRMAKLNLPDSFFYELQRAGYATDPIYATKLFNLFQQVEKLEVA